MTASAAPKSTLLHPTVARLLAFLCDLLLLALFLVFGVAMLNILIELIVLFVGIGAGMTTYKVGDEAVARLPVDLWNLGKAVLWALVAGAIYVGYLRLRRRLFHYFADASFESFVSKRYLIAREGGRLVSLISIVSVLGVSVGVMALIVVISVMNGFDQALMRKFMGVFSHIDVQPSAFVAEEPFLDMGRADELIEKITQIPGVVAGAPYLNHGTVIMLTVGAEEQREFALFRGIDPARERFVTEFADYIVFGTDNPGDREVIVGEALARKMGLMPGSRIFAVGRMVAGPNRTAARTMQLRVAGIFKSGLFDVDDKFIYANLETVQQLLVLDDQVSGVHFRVEDPRNVALTAERVAEILPRDLSLRTWQQLNPDFFNALWIEKVAMFIILLLIVLVAALNIIGTLVMTVVQKTRDIGILKSMGATNTSILKIFLYHGTFIGIVGTSLGTAWGLRLCAFVENDIEKIFELPPGVYGLDRLPVVVDPSSIALMAGSALFICIAASIIPAWQASRLNPVEALRFEA